MIGISRYTCLRQERALRGIKNVPIMGTNK